ncbi:PREDICTED: uncharacterized oxidoreductase YjmC [Drosophila arizonae]|uniref:Uncharacterized oxidoreductase YjmC n=1 Tax=Drosophila arizonae TaxID=7263 RepID=A0ABM1Q253_DROAR|nr:PREDICTED: uncharacterized oxidoreductase YjmC [Drosophila arizonae]
MRKVLYFLDTLRKVRPLPSTDTLASTSTTKEIFQPCGGQSASEANNSGTKCNAPDPRYGRPGSDLLWENLKRVLLMCRGYREPQATIANCENKEVLVDVLEAQRFVRDVFAAMDVPHEAAGEMADALIAADYMGQRSMGIHQLPAITVDLHNLTIDPHMQPKVLSERDALALVDGQNAPGPVVANYCMDLAMDKARKQGLGYVAACHSNSIGLESWYASQALSHRMIGICMSNGPATLVPNGGVEPLLGRNSIACAAGSTREQLLMEVGMSAYPIEQLELEYSNGYLHDLPDNVALNCHGMPTTCIVEALRAQRLRAFTPEHKGFGLAAMVDILCGVMTGARYASQLRRRGLFSWEREQADLGQVYIAIDPMRFCVSFEERLADFHQLLRSVIPCDPAQPPWLPGDKELQHMQMVDDQGGLPLLPCTVSILQDLSDRFNIEPLRINNVSK